MEKKPEKKKKDAWPEYDIENTVSTTDCTGFIPAMVQDEGSAEAYAELYGIHAKPRGADKEKEKERE